MAQSLLRAGVPLVGLLLAGCSGSAPPAPVSDSQPAPLDQGWIASIVAQPESFAAAMDRDGRDAWVAMYKADYDGAARAFGAGLPAARAHLELALVHEDLARLGATAWPMLLDRWQQSDPSISDGSLPMLAALAQADRGRQPTIDLDDGAQAFVDSLGPGKPVQPPTLDDPAAVACLQAQTALRDGADTGLPDGCGDGSPLLQEAGHTLHDPLLHGTQALLHRQQAEQLAGAPLVQALAEGGDEALLFGPWWSHADLLADTQADPGLRHPGQTSPTLEALQLPSAGDGDDVQAARERVRALDQQLDAWRQDQLDGAGDDGRSLLVDLDVVAQARSRVLVVWARQALAQDRPHQATAYLQMGHDVEDARALGPTNPPALFALQAEAWLRTGRTRQSLDALRVLEASMPQLEGLDETIGDLAVLEGMGRQGDSKEN